MKRQLKNSIKVFVILPFAILGIAWLIYYPTGAPSFLLGFGILVFGLLISFLVGRKQTKIALLFSSLFYAYLLGEGMHYLISPPASISGFNQPCTEFDPIRGYRWLGDSVRGFKTSNGTVVYDNYFHPNNKGWIMDQDYTFCKEDSTKKRWMILGDSFVAGIMLETNLPNRTQQLVKDSTGNSALEIYSFGVDGGGIMNWYNVFFKEIVPNYEFDGVIIAPYADNLYRDFMVMLIQENGFMGRIDSVDWFEVNRINPKDFKALKPYKNNIYSNSEIDQFLTQPLKQFDWALKRKIRHLGKKMNGKNRNHSSESIRTINELNGKMGDKKFAQLDSILSWSRINQKQIILASIPSSLELKGELEGIKSFHRNEMQIIADEYKLDYFDGYEVFSGMKEEEINAHWLKYDGHWNQKGSDRYAKYFVNYLQQFK